MRDWGHWFLCVLAAAIPLGLFIAVLSVFEAGDPYLQSVIRSQSFADIALKPFPASRLAIVTLEYGTWVFAHIFLCVAVTAYFGTLFAAHANATPGGVAPRAAALILYAGGVIAVLAVLTLSADRSGETVHSPFADLVVAPSFYFLRALDFSGQFGGFRNDPWIYLSVAALIPTAFGILCVVAASGLFHHDVQNRRSSGEEGWEEDFAKCLIALKTYTAILSLILVSSTLTARAYFHIIPSLMVPPGKEPAPTDAIYIAYKDFATVLSTGTGVLFTMTLIASFAPGMIVLLRDASGIVRDHSHTERHELMERLGLSDLRSKMTSMMRIGLTLASPALAAPIADVFQTL